MSELADHIAAYGPSGVREAFLFVSGAGAHPIRHNFRRSVFDKASDAPACKDGEPAG